MIVSDLSITQREKEEKFLKTFLLWSLVGSAVIHGVALASNPSRFWSNLPESEPEEIEVLVEPEAPPAPQVSQAETPVAPEPPPKPQVSQAETQIVPPPPKPQVSPEKAKITPKPPPEVKKLPQEKVAIAPPKALPPPPAPPPAPVLAPSSRALLTPGKDAPSNKPLTRSSEVINPITSNTGDTKVSVGGGPIIRPEGRGSGFGNNAQPSGFAPRGRPDGVPGGQPNGVPGGQPGGVPGGQLNGVPGGVPGGQPTSTAIRGPLPQTAAPVKLRCLKCPKPKYRGSEGSPRVIYDIAADGRVTNVRLRQSSGNPESDQETLETLSRWQFDPKTIPEGGRRNVRVKVTFEQEGSTYQRQNEQQRRRQETERRRLAELEQQRQQQEAERRRLAERERQQREAEQQNRSTPATTTTPAPPTLAPQPAATPPQTAAPLPELSPTPAPAGESAPPTPSN